MYTSRTWLTHPDRTARLTRTKPGLFDQTKRSSSSKPNRAFPSILLGAPHSTTGSTSLNHLEHLTQPMGAPHSTNGSTSLNHLEHLTQPLGAPHSTTWSTSLNHWEHLTQPLGAPQSTNGSTSLNHWEHLTQPLGAPHSTNGSTSLNHWATSSQTWTSLIYPNYIALHLYTLQLRTNII